MSGVWVQPDGAAVTTTSALDAVGEGDRHVERRVAAHRAADDRGLLDVEGVEHLHRVAVKRVRAPGIGRRAEAAGVEADRVEAVG